MNISGMNAKAMAGQGSVDSIRPAPPGGGYAPFVLSIVIRFCMVLCGMFETMQPNCFRMARGALNRQKSAVSGPDSGRGLQHPGDGGRGPETGPRGPAGAAAGQLRGAPAGLRGGRQLHTARRGAARI